MVSLPVQFWAAVKVTFNPLMATKTLVLPL